nr:alpha/beta hydrolase [Nocardia transvalensis]
MIHGHGGNWQYWLPTMSRLASRRRVIAVDLPGFGRSAPVPWRSAAFATTAATLARLCTHLGLDRVHLIGHSLGTLIACELAAAQPDLVTGVTLVNGPPLSAIEFARHPIRIARRHPQLARVALTDLATAGLPIPTLIRQQVAARPRLRDAAFATYMGRPPTRLPADLALKLLDGVGAPGYYQVPLLARHYDPHPAHTRIRCPVQLINGAQDPLVPDTDIARFCASGAPIHDNIRIEAAGHLVNLEKPTQFHHHLERFLTVTETRTR